MFLAVIAAVFLCFGLVVFVGAPYLPTLDKQKVASLDLLALKPGQTLVELGSGDGRVLKAAANRGINCVGYELNPMLVIISRLATIKQRDKIKIMWGNYWSQDWSNADGIFVFLHSQYMQKLDEKLSAMDKKVRLASVIYQVPGKHPVKTKANVFLYQY